MPWQIYARSKTQEFTNLTAGPYNAIPSDLVRAGEKRSQCALQSYCEHKLRVEISCCHDITRAPKSFWIVSEARDTRFVSRFVSLFVESSVWATTILHNPMAFATMSAFPRVFAMDDTGSHVSLSGMTLLRNLRNHEQVLKALRDELATPSVTKATLSSPVFWRTSPTSVCCPWNN